MNGLDKAKELADAGLFVFFVDDNKRPLTDNGCSDATQDHAVLAGWYAQYGNPEHVAVNAGMSGLVLLDIDEKPEKGLSGHRSLSNASLQVPDTFSYESRSGGLHAWFSGPAIQQSLDLALADGTRLAAVDRKSGNTYGVWWSDEVPVTVDEFTKAPDWLLHVPATTAASGFDGTYQQWMDTVGAGEPDGVMRHIVKQFADKVPNIGHQAMLSVQKDVVLNAVGGRPGANTVFDNLRAIYLSGDWAGSPKYTADWDNALRGAIHNYGGTIPDALIEDVTPMTDETATPVWKSVSNLMDMKFRELDWVIPGLICEGTSMIAAPPKAGKSLFMLDIAVAAAGGTEALGGLPTGTPRPTLYIDLESGERRMQARLRSLGKVIPSESFFYHLNSETAIETFHKFMAAYRGQRPLVIVDTWVAVSKVKGRDEQQYAFDHKSMAQFQQVTAGDPGSAVILVHHTNKGMATDPMNAINGTNGVAGGIDSPMVLTRERLSDEATLTCMPRDWEGGEFLFNFSGRWSVAGGSLDGAQNSAHKSKAEERKSHFGPGKQSVLDIIEGSEESMTIGQVTEQYVGSGGKTAVSRYLAQLSDATLIQRITTGVYKKL